MIPPAIPYRPIMWRVCGDAVTTLYLEALICLYQSEPPDWIVPDQHEIEDATGLSPETQRRCRNKLGELGLIVTRRGTRTTPGGIFILQDAIAAAIAQVRSGSTSTSLTMQSRDALELRRQTWDAYATAIKERYGVLPLHDATNRALIKRLCQRTGKDTPDIVKWYVQHNDRWFVQNGHSLQVLLARLDGIYVQWKTGRPITQRTAQTVERVSGYHNLLRLITENNDGTA